eukprot:TRINITY_DN29768_c0_g1_i1.p2 TRINITY_DN29768_c0_g1~~TRINITY_DN29768_c0_g1_i1.p2  ORF type:complete len:538 (+),score=218.56 TRINITY_DN29768_c0_g1_i1:56-1669(+)
MAVRSVWLVGLAAAAVAGIPDPSRFSDFFESNKLPDGLPLSYNVWPARYFDDIPAENRSVHTYDAPVFQAACGRESTPAEMLAYEFQTEQLLTALGLNIYDGAMRSMAIMLLGKQQEAQDYLTNTLLAHKTTQFPDIRGDAPCQGVVYSGECADPQQTGKCGFCYGDTAARTLDVDHAYFFRMVTDYWSIEGTIDQRCPEKQMAWTWNDYTPVLGENSWASLISPMQVAYHVADGNLDAIPDDGAELKLATQFLTALEVMKVGDTGAFYYTPHNTWFYNQPNMGSTVSTENMGSTLAGLKMLHAVIDGKATSVHKALLPQIQGFIDGAEKYLMSAWDAEAKFFRQGGTYDAAAGEFHWVQGDSPKFATDCQTWVSTALGTAKIDAALGENTAYNLWQTVKQYTGYKPTADGKVSGVGFTDKTFKNLGEVFSGEWTLGAINWLRVMAEESNYSDEQKQSLRDDADYMRDAIEHELLQIVPTQKAPGNNFGVKYSNRRYWIPFGWWANSIQSTASTAWAVAVDKSWNPLRLGGKMTSVY